MNKHYSSGDSCDCNHQQPDPLRGLAIAMGYVPWQHMTTTYEPDKALREGTIFPELNKPFGGRRIR
jgi:hypothetical protein